MITPTVKAHALQLTPSFGTVPLRLADVWEYRELFYFLLWRDIKVRYKQTALGVAWAILQPLLTMIVFSILFGRLAKIPSNGVPYPVFAFTGLLPWQLFAQSLTECSSSLVTNQNLITKVYFPRLIIPMAAVGTGLVDFCISFCVLLSFLLYYRIPLTITILALPLFLLFAVLTSLGAGLWLSALNVKYRDVRYTVPFLAQFWMFVTPVAYPISLVPQTWRPIYGLNPMTGVVEGFRWALLGKTEPPGLMIAVSAAMVTAIFVGGLYYFRRLEITFGDTM